MMHNEKLVGALETDQNLIKFYYKCYKHHESNLIFFPYLKCATSTYKKLFEKLSWNSIDINDIDWNKDHVFSHIKDPLVRHRKGIVEGICEYSPKVKDFFFTD